MTEDETGWMDLETIILNEVSQKKRQNRKYYCRDLGWRRLLGVPWTARRSNQSILKEINPEYPLEGLMLN